MKTIKLFAVVIASLACMSFSPAKGKKADGIWRGVYSTADTSIGIIMLLKKGNITVWHAERNSSVPKTKGSYSINIDNIMRISFRLPASNGRIVMTGEINTYRDFVSGDWRAENNQTGDFCLHKQECENDERIVAVKLVSEAK